MHKLILMVSLILSCSLFAVEKMNCNYNSDFKKLIDCNCSNSNTTREINTCWAKSYYQINKKYLNLYNNILDKIINNNEDKKHKASFVKLHDNWISYREASGREVYDSYGRGSGRATGATGRKISLTIDRINTMKNFRNQYLDNLGYFLGKWYNPINKIETLLIKKDNKKYYCELKTEEKTIKGSCLMKETFLYIGKDYEWVRFREVDNHFYSGQIVYFPRGDGSTNSRYMIKKD